MVQILGDELRNPLAAMALSVARMKARAQGPDQLCDVLDRQVDRLTALVNQLLDASRASFGPISIDRRVELHTLIANAVAATLAAHTGAAPHVEMNVARSGLAVACDRYWLGQALVQVLGNSIKFAAPGRPGHIRISAAADDGAALIRLIDDGVGVAPDKLEAIFEPFVQGFPLATRSRRGLGLGLTIARRLVELHGGSIHARSAGEGCGFEVQIRLPLALWPIAEGGPR
jgi:signal transduction histidine kinase